MDLNGKLNLKHHHLTCLSTSSQAPLINNNGNFLSLANQSIVNNRNNIESISARSTPNPLNPFNNRCSSGSGGSNSNNNNSNNNRSPTAANNNSKINSSHLSHQQKQPNTPLILATPSSATNALVSSSVFFPPLPARTSLQQRHFSTNSANRSPKSAEMMINIGQQQQQSQSQCQSQSQHHKNGSGSRDSSTNGITFQQRFPNSSNTSTSQSSKLNSPNIMPAKSFSGFFAEPLFSSSSSTSFGKQQQQASRRSINQLIPSTFGSFSDVDKWSTQQQQQQLVQDDTYHIYHEPEDPDDQEEKSPEQLSPQDNRFSFQTNEKSLPLSSSSQANSPNSIKNDVSADIYFCYVASKSNARSNLKSRSYHGHKNNPLKAPNNSNLQALSSNSVAELPFSPIMDEIRQSCIDELITTEMNYTHALNIIITYYAKPLEPFLKREDNQLIFSHMKYFYNIHSAFQNDLVKNAPNIASCFLNARDKFLRYGEYCATLLKAQAVVEELINKNETIAAQIERCHREANEGKFKLADLLSLPMQRILKYHLILGQLVKSTSPRHEDYNNLKRAHEAMLDLNKYINEAKRDTESMQIINDIEQAITGLNMQANTQLTDYGRLHFDGTIKVKLPSDERSVDCTKVKLKRYSFVFDKVFLMCKMGYQYKEALLLNEFYLDTDPAPQHNEHHQQPLMMTKSLIREKWSYSFNLIRQSDKSIYSFFTKDLEKKHLWIEAIQRAMDNLRPAACRNTNHEFLMHTFERGSSCDHCGKLFYGLCYQGYRCRTCFSSVHKDCISAIRPCGPTIKPSQPLAQSPKVRDGPATNVNLNLPNAGLLANEPPSPSVRSNSSELSENNNNGSNFFSNFSHPLHELSLKDNTNFSHKSNNNNEKPPTTDNSYYNYIPSEYPWFCGRMERDKAQACLENMPQGTFLVRVSPKHNESYVISLKYNNQVKHMRIHLTKDNQLYLSHNRYFKSIVELVSWYEKNSLVESFNMLDAHLAIPYKAN